MAINLDNYRGVTLRGKDIRQILRKSDGKILWAGEHYINCTNCGANATVTATHSSGRSYSAVANASGNATITVYDDGNFTVSTTYKSQSKTVNVPAATESVSMRFRYYLYDNGLYASSFSETHNWANMYPTDAFEANTGKTGYLDTKCLYGGERGVYLVYGSEYRGVFLYRTADLTNFTRLCAKIKGYWSSNDPGSAGFGISNNAPSWNKSVAQNSSLGIYFDSQNISAQTKSLDISSISGNKYVFVGGGAGCPYAGYGHGTFECGVSELYLD